MPEVIPTEQGRDASEVRSTRVPTEPINKEPNEGRWPRAQLPHSAQFQCAGTFIDEGFAVLVPAYKKECHFL